MTTGIDFSMHAALDTMCGRRPGQPADGGSLDERDTATPQFASRMWPVNTAAPQWSGVGTYDVPQVFGPMPGYVWVIRRVSAATFSAGTVNLYVGLPADNNLQYAFTAPGSFFPGGQGIILLYGDRLTFAPGAAITGPVTLSMSMTQLTADLLPRFLM